MSADVYAVPEDHPAFDGHFPGAPLLPGAVLLDEVAARAGFPAEAPVRFSGVKFRRAVLPGASLRIQYESSDRGLRFTIVDDDGAVADGRIDPA
ncbi:MAG: beta-hydroxyacyl-ACP dehydratase [Steroidobacteraceae bacterium]